MFNAVSQNLLYRHVKHSADLEQCFETSYKNTISMVGAEQRASRPGKRGINNVATRKIKEKKNHSGRSGSFPAQISSRQFQHTRASLTRQELVTKARDLYKLHRARTRTL
ncbi:hypothetical protein RRG08_039644 [Elysia crispata]|uniref:Uncharacterized protein n=1 Tax=Elysia crispata TaxID=231223 RepID=A0AAE1CV79_9GAST|nr:hypothetical protein RRG08_039644 [Elysia crispata]